ncbi:hypothetical protein EI94DRAFT_1753376, partial [Lactarius quietus]
CHPPALQRHTTTLRQHRLFFKSGALAWFPRWSPRYTARRALRVVISELGKEYTDSSYIGEDAQGIFYYGAASDITGKVKARVYKVTVDDNGNSKNYAHIKFFTKDEDQTYAEFIAEDPDSAVDATGMEAYTKKGRDGECQWIDLNVGTANAQVYKKSNETTIDVTASSIRKTATLTLDDASDLPGAVVVKGTLYFKNISDLNNDEAKYASYNNDRIVFYGDENSGKDFVAYVSFEGSTGKLGISSENTLIISVTWDST